MKVKLLKKLRNRFYIAGRNGKYKVFDSDEEKGQPDDDYCYGSKWMNKEDAIKKRRKKILKAAKDYLEYKTNIN
tara:strand:- start:314 stop:535 length:222 start_codon:yes stop_codon:yes gene_type:complete